MFYTVRQNLISVDLHLLFCSTPSPLIILCKAEHFPLGIQNLIQNTCQDVVENKTIASSHAQGTWGAETRTPTRWVLQHTAGRLLGGKS